MKTEIQSADEPRQDAQTVHPLRPSFVKRRSSLARSPRDTLHEERFTDDENAAGGLFQYPAMSGGRI
jgi:hypothetical protein